MTVDMIAVNMPEEMLNDAKGHLISAKKFEKEGKVFQRWREVRATATFAVAAVESLLNKIAFEYVQKNPKLDPAVKDYLSENMRVYENGQITLPRY